MLLERAPPTGNVEIEEDVATPPGGSIDESPRPEPPPRMSRPGPRLGGCVAPTRGSEDASPRPEARRMRRPGPRLAGWVASALISTRAIRINHVVGDDSKRAVLFNFQPAKRNKSINSRGPNPLRRQTNETRPHNQQSAINLIAESIWFDGGRNQYGRWHWS